MCLSMRIAWSSMCRFVFYSCWCRCLHWNTFGRGGGFPQTSNNRCWVSFGPLITTKRIAFIQLTHMCLLMRFVWLSTRQFAFYSYWFRCLRWDSFGREGRIPSIFKQPLLGEFWSPYHNKKHSIHPINSYVFIDVLGLESNVSVCHLQLLV